MNTFLFCLHISAALLIGHNAYHRGRSFIVWTLLTLIPYAIFVTWPLLYILPRLPRSAQISMLEDTRPKNLPSTTDNKSFYVGVTVWVVCLVVIGLGIVIIK